MQQEEKRGGGGRHYPTCFTSFCIDTQGSTLLGMCRGSASWLIAGKGDTRPLKGAGAGQAPVGRSWKWSRDTVGKGAVLPLLLRLV